MVRLAHEMKKKSTDPTKVTRSKVWVAGHTHANGKPVREEFAETIEKVKSIDSEMESTAAANVREDAVSQVLGKDKPGRLRGMGRGYTFTKLAFLQARDSHVQKLEATQAELLSKIEDLRLVVHNLAGKKTCQLDSDDVSASEIPEVGKGGIRCQLLDWCSSDDVVVGEGEFCSTEHMYKIGRIPLGPNAVAVMVKSVTKPEAYVWRPTSTIITLGDTVGAKIAWPADKVILDNTDSCGTKTDGSSDANASAGRVHILDWNWEGEIIGEGILCTTDPKALVNNIPLGPNAASLKVIHVERGNAFLWRPSAEMSVLSDALNENIPWPIEKVQLVNPGTPLEETAKISHASGSNSTSSSKGTKPKCILLDCNGSGQRVAQGRVASTDPTDKVHFVPLGPNASKVWVEVSKVDDARVWRPNSEVEVIADAVGTTVAWPNDKLILL